MSSKAGTIEQTRPGVSWTGAWIVAVLLTVIMAVAVFAINRSGGGAEPASQTARYEVNDQLSGGPHPVTKGGTPVTTETGFRIGDTICHQCR